jgi:hypothetical protein
MTSHMNIDAATPRVEIGSTWNAASSQGSGRDTVVFSILEHE